MSDTDDEPMWVADRNVAPTPGSTITLPKTINEFSIKGNHLTLVKGNQFDRRTKTDPHKHVHEFLTIYKVLLKLDWAKNLKNKTPIHKTVAFADEGKNNSETQKLLARMDVMSIKMDAQFKEMKDKSHETCSNCGGNHSSADCNDDETPMSREEEEKFMQTF
ncbi:hypothetical protein Tco_0661944 [Tanacetum coccineum]